MNEIKFIAGGYEYRQFTRVEVYKTIDAIAGYMSICMPDYYPADQGEWGFNLGDDFVLDIDGQPVCTGYIEDISLDYSSENHYITVSGRDKTGDLIDCNLDNTKNEWKNSSVLAILSDLCSDFDIEIVVDSTAADARTFKIDTCKIGEGENVFSIIQRICFATGIIPVSLGDGKLTLIKSGNTYNTDSIEMGVNATHGNCTFSNRDRYSKYIVKGYGIGNDNKSVETYIQPQGYANDSIIKRTRPLIMFSEIAVDSGKCDTRARWERQTRAGQSRSRTYRVKGLVQSDEVVWKINEKVKIHDTMIGIEVDMLISDIKFVYNKDDGFCTYITVVDLNTYTTNDTVIKSEFDA